MKVNLEIIESATPNHQEKKDRNYMVRKHEFVAMWYVCCSAQQKHFPFFF